MADIMGHISNTNHVVDNTTIGIPVQERMLKGEAMYDIYGQIAKLTNRVEELARNIAAIECKMERNRSRSVPDTHEW